MSQGASSSGSSSSALVPSSSGALTPLESLTLDEYDSIAVGEGNDPIAPYVLGSRSEPHLATPGSSVDNPTIVIPRDGLRTVDLGHGRNKPAEPVVQGDKLGMAAQANDIIKVQKLLKRGVSPNIRNNVSGVTPLGVAAERGHLEIVKLLLGAKADVDATTNDGLTPLHISSQFGMTEVVSMLIRASANVNTESAHMPGGYHGFTPLMSAVIRQALPTIRALLEARANVNAIPRLGGGSALHLACRCGYPDVVRLLLEPANGADVLLRNRERETALEVAIVQGTDLKYLECASILRPMNAEHLDYPLADKSHAYIKRAMDRVAARTQRLMMEATDPEAQVPIAHELIAAYLRTAAALGDVRTVKDLATDLGLVDSRDSQGRTALHLACEGGQLGTAAALIARHASVDHRTNAGSTTLHLASAGDFALIVRLLLKQRADPQLRDAHGRTPLDVAGPDAKLLLQSHLKTVKALELKEAAAEDDDSEPIS